MPKWDKITPYSEGERIMFWFYKEHPKRFDPLPPETAKRFVLWEEETKKRKEDKAKDKELHKKEIVRKKSRTPYQKKRDGKLRKYGIDHKHYERMLKAQGGRCAICGTNDYGSRGVLFVDHDHDTGDVRGLLCSRCNMVLGFVRDDVETLRKAAEYLDGYFRKIHLY